MANDSTSLTNYLKVRAELMMPKLCQASNKCPMMVSVYGSLSWQEHHQTQVKQQMMGFRCIWCT